MNPQEISNNIQRYLALRKHHDPIFNKVISNLEQWKMEQMAYCYSPLMDTPSHEKLLNYYFEEIFCGIDLSELREAKSTVKFIEKFFTGTDMLLAALEFNALTGEINQSLTEHIFEEKKHKEVNIENYTEACQQGSVIKNLELQISLFETFAEDRNTTVSNRFVQTSIKVARLPAKLSGCGKLYKLVEDGFSILKEVDDPEHIASTLINHERLIISRLASNTQPAYVPAKPIPAP